jgi:hypothetical protein
MISKVAGIVFLAFGSMSTAHATQLITNGGFDTGTLSGWNVMVQSGSYPGSNFFDLSSTTTTTPQSFSTTAGAKSGADYAVSDTAGTAAIVLSQSFVVPAHVSSVILSYSLFVNSGSAGAVNTINGLDYTKISSQYGIVSLLSAGTSLFSTGVGDLANFYEGIDAVGVVNPYKDYSFDITSLVSAGGSFTLRFGAVSNVATLNVGVDSVSVISTVTAVPEPASTLLCISGLAGLTMVWFRKTGSNRAIDCSK